MKKEQIRTIEIDVDGVIYDIWDTFFNDNRFKYAAEAQRLKFTAEDFKDFACSGLTDEPRIVTREAFSDVEFMTNLRLNPCVPDSICLLRSMFEYKQVDCVVINTVVSNEEIAYLRKWQLTELFTSLKHYNFLISVFVKTEKADFGCDALIEDNLDAVVKSRQKHKLNCLIDAPYNRLRSFSDIVRFDNLYAALKHVNKYNLEENK